MNTIEDRLRAATRAAADTVAPESAPPLRLHAQPGRQPGFRRRHRRPWPRAIAPVAAAAAVIAVVAASLAVTGGMPGRHRGTRAAAGGAAAHGLKAPALTAAGRAALASVPPYYVALTGSMGERQQAVVRATATGAVLATITAPRPYNTFRYVTGAADDRTFVLAAQQWWPIAPGASGAAAEKRDDSTPTKFFLLRLNPAGRTAQLKALPVPPEPGGAWVDGIALSLDGSRLAVADDRSSPEVDPKIQVFTLAAGSEREWVWPGTGWIGNNKPIGSPLSWAANGRTLAFQVTPATGTIAVRLLDTAAPGGSLRSSKLAVEWIHGGVIGDHGVVVVGANDAPANSLAGLNTLITPDGTKIVCVTNTTKLPAGATEFSASTARVVGVLYPQATEVLWASSTGSTLIVANSRAAGVLTRSQFTPIPGTSQISPSVAW